MEDAVAHDEENGNKRVSLRTILINLPSSVKTVLGIGSAALVLYAGYCVTHDPDTDLLNGIKAAKTALTERQHQVGRSVAAMGEYSYELSSARKPIRSASICVGDHEVGIIPGTLTPISEAERTLRFELLEKDVIAEIERTRTRPQEVVIKERGSRLSTVIYKPRSAKPLWLQVFSENVSRAVYTAFHARLFSPSAEPRQSLPAHPHENNTSQQDRRYAVANF